jgi:hypothetical protein
MGISGSELLKGPGPDGGCRTIEEDFLFVFFFYCKIEFLIGTRSCNIAAVVGVQQWTLFRLSLSHDDYSFKDAEAILM